jgi:aldose 1-epimerase
MKSSEVRQFGVMADGRGVREAVLRGEGISASILEYGAVVRDLHVRRADGGQQRVVLGLNTIEDYVAHAPHFGAIAGRFANRIALGRFSLDGLTYQLPLNQDGKHALHGGGATGLGKSPWMLADCDGHSATLVHVSPDGYNGYPGMMTVVCRYSVRGTSLLIDLSAFTDAPTIINLCHHSYFNLDGSGDILDHDLAVNADLMTPVDDDLIPDGTMALVAGTPFDFRHPRKIRRMGSDGGRIWYDHNFILRRDRCERASATLPEIAHAATLSSPKSGLAMEVWTSEPALQVYDGFKLALPVAGLGGARYAGNAGICLEPQHVPDSPNKPQFPSTVLRPGELYRQRTEYRFRQL